MNSFHNWLHLQHQHSYLTDLNKRWTECWCSCGSVVEYCVSSSRGCGFNSQGTHILGKKSTAWMHCKSLRIKASAKCVNVNWLEQNNDSAALNVEKLRVLNPFWGALYLTRRQKKNIIYFYWATFLKEKSFEDVPKTRFYQIQLETIFFSSLVKGQIVIDY